MLDETRFNTVIRDVGDIKTMIRGLSDDLTKGFSRVHQRIDDEASKSRHLVGNEISKMAGTISYTRKEVDDEIDAVSGRVSQLETKASGKIIGALVGIILILLGIVGFFAAQQVRPPGSASITTQWG